ncbi:MAG TPA: peptide-methionine (S)-S-oxide reductase MsrA [Pyrinomonadaceae bacterium]|nr:peptide-methionine (S)-S-oxide reductase MsrA [Pyrinomonadaceae bacterium]
MRSMFFMKLITIVSIAVAVGCGVVSSSKTADLSAVPPMPASQNETEVTKGKQTAVFAGGCFWGVEAVFESLKGVSDAKSGYAGGTSKTANYDDVSNGNTQHAEAVLVTYEPEKISYAQLLKVFFTVAHDPTELNRQGPDIGPQYRSAIFYSNEDQQKQAAAFIAELDKSQAWPKAIVTQVVPLEKFYVAEAYHQNYLVRNPTQPYIVMHDMPKLEELKKRFPELYSGK